MKTTLTQLSLLLWALALSTLSLQAQEKFSLSGYISDGETGETLIGATVYVPAVQKGVTTNEYGFYSLTLPAGNYEVWAGTDNDNDFFICDDGETCGAYQTMDEPVVLKVNRNRANINFSSDYQISLRTASNNLNASASTAAQNPPTSGLRRIQRPQQRD